MVSFWIALNRRAGTISLRPTALLKICLRMMESTISREPGTSLGVMVDIYLPCPTDSLALGISHVCGKSKSPGMHLRGYLIFETVAKLRSAGFGTALSSLRFGH
jgi:hypothetical protein